MTEPDSAAGLGGLTELLEGHIQGYGVRRALVAFSGGVDSATVLALSARALGCAATVAVTAVSPSYPAGELERARDLARSIGVVHRSVTTGEVGQEGYARNTPLRCLHCKNELYETFGLLAREAWGEDELVVLDGTNADDARVFRPGLNAATHFGVRSPLLEMAVDKEQVRAIARYLRLAVADKPALACLASRVAYGIRISADLLKRIDRAEAAVRTLGFDPVRVRHFGDRAVVEVPPSEVSRLTQHVETPALLDRIRAMGWTVVVIDAQGYRPGRMNENIEPPRMPTRLLPSNLADAPTKPRPTAQKRCP